MVEEPPPPPGGPSGSGAPGDDPLAWLTLDEHFIRAAQRAEPSAAERARAAREANLRRRLADESAQRENEQHAQRRYAPSSLHSEGRARRRRRSGAPRSRQWRSIGMAALGVAVLVLMAIEVRRGASTGLANTAEIARPTNWPPAAEDVAPRPLGEPGPVPQGGGSHAFTTFQPDGVTPVAYDPCRPIHYVTRPGGPAGADLLVREAVAGVSAATGLVFVDDGETDEAPSDDRQPYQPDRYGERWAPVLITWSDPAESPRLGTVDPAAPEDDVAGFAGSQSVGLGVVGGSDPDQVFVTGGVTLDTADFVEMLARPDGAALAHAVIAHELGHLAGLQHVDDASQLMYARNTGLVTEYQAGDLEGLAALGRGACFPDI